MPVDTSIYNSLMRPVKSVAEYDAEAQALEQNALAGRLRQQQFDSNALTMRQAQQKQAEADADAGALRTIAAGWNAQTTPEQRIAGLRNSGRAGLMTQADTVEKQWIERTKGESEARAKQAEVLGKVLTAQGDLATRVLANPTPQAAAAAIANMKAITQALGVQIDFSGDEAALSQFQTPDQIKQWAAGHALKAQELLPKLQTINRGGSQLQQAVDPITGMARTTGEIQNTQTPDSIASNARMAADAAAARAVTIRGQNLTDARSRESNDASLSKPFEVTGSDGTPVLVQQTKDGRIVPVQGYSPKGGNATKVVDAKEALALLDQAEPLIKGSTGSTIGAGLDAAAKAFGYATPGSIKAQQLKALEGALVAKMPKMSGPQSDKDVMLYRQMAAEIGDPTVPYERKAAAMETVRQIQERYAGMPAGSSKPAAPGAFNDAEKERRYQEWKRKQGQQ